nr:MAG TPA: major capsid protein [Caudoviricetes sp.]
MPDEIRELIEQQGKAFEEFRKANDARLDALEKDEARSELEEKTDRINDELGRLSAAVDELAKKANRPGAPGAEGDEALQAEHKAAWLKWVRKGDDDGLADIERKAMNVGTPADGGYAVPIQQDRDIMRLLTDLSPMRQVCRVMTVGTEDYRKLVNLGGTASGWVGETDARPATAGPTLAQLKPSFGELYANPEVTQKALDDIFFDVEGELSQDISESFAVLEGKAFLSGTGTNQPVGLLTAKTSADADSARAFGTVQHIATGVADNFPAKDPADILIDLIYSMKAGYRTGAQFMMNSMTLAAMRKWKDGQGNYIWQPAMQNGQPGSIFGYGYVTNEDMPSAGASAIPVVFGNFQQAYIIFDRVGIRSLRDPYTNKPFVGFYTTKRVGSMIANTQAVKFLKCAA